MYLHAGAGRLIRGDEIIGVFDMDGKQDSEINREFLKKSEKKGQNSAAGEDLPRSFIVCDSGVVFSHLSTAAITSRSRD